MDARELLRRYLEQRRELGESEFVLDGMSVEEAMALLGARGAGSRDAARPAPERGPASAPAPPSVPRPAPPPERGDEPPMPPDASSDWRAALRAAGASGPGGEMKKPVAKADAPPPAAATPKPAPADPAPPPGAGGGLTVGGEGGELFGGPFAHLDSLADIAQAVEVCTRCPLYATATRGVPGEGNPNADFMVVGEAPGATEDETGRPFVGAAGQLLTKILAAIDLKREDVFIANVLKHRPPGNRNPMPEEVVACSPYLVRQIELIRPKVILAVGTFAAQTLLDTKTPIGKLRGQVHRYHGVPLIVTYHPAALLRNPAWKRPTWEDVQLARRILDSASTGA